VEEDAAADAMKRALLVVAVGLGVWVGLAATRGIAAAPSCTPNEPHQSRLIVSRLHIWNKPILLGYAARSKGPIWDPDFNARPGQGRSSVIQAHDVTPVPGYGKHGPFYRLPSMRRGDLATITRCGVSYTYRFVRSFTAWQCHSKAQSLDPGRYDGSVWCFPNDTPVTGKHWLDEQLYFRCCWPRHTDYRFYYVRLALISSRPVSG
jgi:hypothetical protein